MQISKHHEKAALIATIVIIEFISGFTQGYYEPLIPKFGTLLNVDASGLQLFNVVPTAVAALFVPLLTRLGDIKGYRKLLRFVIPVVFLATVLIWLGATTQSWALVLFGRLLNGPIAVWLPLHIALIYTKTDAKTATSAVSAVVATMTLGTVVGTASSGFIYMATLSLASTVVLIPCMQLIAVLLVIFVMPEYVSGADTYIDGKGFVALGVFMLVAILGFVEVVGGGTDTAIGASCLVVAGIVGFFWYRHQKRIDHPAIDVNIMFSRSLFPLYVAAICYGAVFYGFMSPTATFLAADPTVGGYGYGFEADQISIVQTLILVATVVAALLVPMFVRRLKPKPTLVIGFALAAVGFAQWVVPGAGIVKLATFIALVGLGLGIIGATIPVIIPARATDDTRGIATGLFNSAQTLGGALGGGLYVSLLKVGATQTGGITNVGYDTVWTTCAGILMLGLLIVAVFLAEGGAVRESESRAADAKNQTEREALI